MKRRGLVLAIALLMPLGVEPVHASNTLTVFAASSLGRSFAEIAKDFEAKHAGVVVQFSFLSSSTLATQVLAGAPADLFASASESEMTRVISLVPHPKLFATNYIVLAVLKSGSIRINKLTDVNKRGVKWIQCAHSVPCGISTDKALASLGKVTSQPVSLESNVASATAKLLAGEVDAAFIYHTDFQSHAEVLKQIRFTDMKSATTSYPIGVIKGSANKPLAQSFMNFVLSPAGQKVLSQDGFKRAS